MAEGESWCGARACWRNPEQDFLRRAQNPGFPTTLKLRNCTIIKGLSLSCFFVLRKNHARRRCSAMFGFRAESFDSPQPSIVPHTCALSAPPGLHLSQIIVGPLNQPHRRHIYTPQIDINRNNPCLPPISNHDPSSSLRHFILL